MSSKNDRLTVLLYLYAVHFIVVFTTISFESLGEISKFIFLADDHGLQVNWPYRLI